MFVITLIVMVCSSCTDESDGVNIVKSRLSKSSFCKLADGTEQIITDRGEIIHITDTTVYEVSSDDIPNDNTGKDDEWSGFSLTRADNNYPLKVTVKGFDGKIQTSGYQKWLFNKETAAKYGVPQGIYLVCFYNVSKELAQSDDESIKPRDYTKNLDDTPMGWLATEYDTNKKFIKGFEVGTNSVNGFVTATTMLRYINCDAYGVSYNKFIPYEPSALVWQYVLSYSPSWD